MAAKSVKFTPYAWAKLLFMRDIGNTEIGAMAITSPSDHLLVEDLVLVKQKCTSSSTEFDTDGIADFFDNQVDAGLHPEQFGRIWVHTHPGNSASPSSKDEETFKETFSGPNWAVMMILANGGADYARLRFNVGPGIDTEIGVSVDFDCQFKAVDSAVLADWKAEYELMVETQSYNYFGLNRGQNNYQGGKQATYLGYQTPNQYFDQTDAENGFANSSSYTPLGGTKPRFADKYTVTFDDGCQMHNIWANSQDEAVEKANSIRERTGLPQKKDSPGLPEGAGESPIAGTERTNDSSVSDESLEGVEDLEFPPGCENWNSAQWEAWDKERDEEEFERQRILNEEMRAIQEEENLDEEEEEYYDTWYSQAKRGNTRGGANTSDTRSPWDYD
jgi:hypothetical protein